MTTMQDRQAKHQAHGGADDTLYACKPCWQVAPAAAKAPVVRTEATYRAARFVAGRDHHSEDLFGRTVPRGACRRCGTYCDGDCTAR